MSTGINVLRYSALGYGVFYGFTHQRSIYSTETKTAAKTAEQKDWQHRADLISKAKAEYLKKFPPPRAATDGSVISNPEDPNFDFEAWATAAAAGRA
ncbi:MAG: hypothetical protein M1828_005540 [Chrysothrix sp. TS-e1954]|nr:MAG: hypothetical protein M1828_005540 [Chrysothrix sp. TS-e1954]